MFRITLSFAKTVSKLLTVLYLKNIDFLKKDQLDSHKNG